jgi:hypothetical protein
MTSSRGYIHSLGDGRVNASAAGGGSAVYSAVGAGEPHEPLRCAAVLVVEQPAGAPRLNRHDQRHALGVFFEVTVLVADGVGVAEGFAAESAAQDGVVDPVREPSAVTVSIRRR